MRFSLIDKITALEPGVSISAVKNVSRSEEYLADHFPGFPVLPGVMMVEALTQTASWFMRYSEDFRYSSVLLKMAKQIKFNNFVSPGRSLDITVSLVGWDGGDCTFKASGTVGGASAVSARLTLRRFNLADENPKLAASDQRQIEWAKATFAELWQGSTAAAKS